MNSKTNFRAVVLILVLFPLLVSFSPNPLGEAVDRLSHEILANGQAYSNLTELTAIGGRLSGSENAARAVDWAKRKMESYGFDRVWLQSVNVPHWTRGTHESAMLVKEAGPETSLRLTALGGSVGTPDGGVTAQVIEVHSLFEVAQLGRQAIEGKIVFYNRPMDPSLSDTFDAYGAAVDQRSAGPSQAARYGAVAVLVRSLTTLYDDDHPHTGVLSYAKDAPMIPAAALSTHAANLLSKELARNPGARVRLELSAERHPLVASYNVIGELAGAEKPDEFVVVGGHLDSWDLAQGAQDDGAGAMQSLEILRAMKAAGLRPKRTVRVVLFMAEEFGGYGGREYARVAEAKGERHVAALESDRGGFAPVGFACESDAATMRAVSGWGAYLGPLHAGAITAGEAGTDIEPLVSQGVPAFGFVPESRHYFDFHHSELDRLEAVDRNELAQGAAAMAAFVYLSSETF